MNAELRHKSENKDNLIQSGGGAAHQGVDCVHLLHGWQDWIAVVKWSLWMSVLQWQSVSVSPKVIVSQWQSHSDIPTVTAPYWQSHSDSLTVTVPQWQSHSDGPLVTVSQWQSLSDSPTVTVPQWRPHIDSPTVTLWHSWPGCGVLNCGSHHWSASDLCCHWLSGQILAIWCDCVENKTIHHLLLPTQPAALAHRYTQRAILWENIADNLRTNCLENIILWL